MNEDPIVVSDGVTGPLPVNYQALDLLFLTRAATAGDPGAIAEIERRATA